jgi:hypothetical protein
MSFETVKTFVFKRIKTGEEVAVPFSTNTIICKFLADISTLFKEKYDIDNYILIQGGTELAENGKIYDFYNYPTRSATIHQVFGDTCSFYVMQV